MNRSFKGAIIIVLLILGLQHFCSGGFLPTESKNITEVKIKIDALKAIFEPILNSDDHDRLNSYVNTLVNNRPTQPPITASSHHKHPDHKEKVEDVTKQASNTIKTVNNESEKSVNITSEFVNNNEKTVSNKDEVMTILSSRENNTYVEKKNYEDLDSSHIERNSTRVEVVNNIHELANSSAEGEKAVHKLPHIIVNNKPLLSNHSRTNSTSYKVEKIIENFKNNHEMNINNPERLEIFHRVRNKPQFEQKNNSKDSLANTNIQEIKSINTNTHRMRNTNRRTNIIKANLSNSYISQEKRDRNTEDINRKYEHLWSSLGQIFDTESHKVPLSMYSRDKIGKDRRNTTEIKAHLHQIKKEIMKKISKPVQLSDSVNNSNVNNDNNNMNKGTNKTNFILDDIKKNNTNVKFYLINIPEGHNDTEALILESINNNSHKESVFPNNINKNNSNVSTLLNNIKEYGQIASVLSDNTAEGNNKVYLTDSANGTVNFLNAYKKEILKKISSQLTTPKPQNQNLQMKPPDYSSLLQNYEVYLNKKIGQVEKIKVMSTGPDGTKQNHADEIRKPDNLKIKIPEIQQENSNSHNTDNIKKPNTEGNAETVFENQEDLVTLTGITDVDDANKLLATILRRKKPQSLSQSGSKNDSLTKGVLNKVKNGLQNIFSSLTSTFGVTVDVPYYSPTEISETLRNIAGGAAIGALALGTIMANPLQVGRRRSDSGIEGLMDAIPFLNKRRGIPTLPPAGFPTNRFRNYPQASYFRLPDLQVNQRSYGYSKDPK